jgi:hypothetical protein
MPYIVAVLPHDFLGKFELMAQRDTEDEVRRIAQKKNPFDLDDEATEIDEDRQHHYSAIIWEGTLEDSYEGTLGKPIAIYYRGVEWKSGEESA